MGAQFRPVAALLLNSTMKQMMFATVIAIPVAYYLTERYLQNFSERITLHWWHLVIPVILLTIIMLITISSLVWKAARKNPVEALKCE
jgi:putative ABC transport system permease protein